MDLVYSRCKYAIGCLHTAFDCPNDVTVFVNLIRALYIQSTDQLYIKDRYISDIPGIIQVLSKISEDQWWHRAWIFQEDHLAGDKMWIMIPCRDEYKPHGSQHVIGSLPGEVVVRASTFKKHVTFFCLACLNHKPNNNMKVKCERLLQRFCRYDIVYKYGTQHFDRPSMTVHILHEALYRSIENGHEMLAVLANACGFKTRITVDEKDSISVCILALLILNGELLIKDDKAYSDYNETILDLVQRTLLTIPSSTIDTRLSLTRRCRLSVHSVSRAGIHARGYLWQLDTRIPLNAKRNSLNAKPGEALDYLSSQLAKMGFRDLARFISHYARALLDLKDTLYGRNRTTNLWSDKHVICILAKRLAEAIQNGGKVYLARLAEKFPSPIQAVFVSNTEVLINEHNVFTSWERSHVELSSKGSVTAPAAYTSILVKRLKGADNFQRLRALSWIDGVSNFRDQHKEDHIFAWPTSFLI